MWRIIKRVIMVNKCGEYEIIVRKRFCHSDFVFECNQIGVMSPDNKLYCIDGNMTHFTCPSNRVNVPVPALYIARTTKLNITTETTKIIKLEMRTILRIFELEFYLQVFYHECFKKAINVWV